MHEIDLGQWFHGNGLRQVLGHSFQAKPALLSTLLQITLVSEISDDLLSVY